MSGLQVCHAGFFPLRLCLDLFLKAVLLMMNENIEGNPVLGCRFLAKICMALFIASFYLMLLGDRCG